MIRYLLIFLSITLLTSCEDTNVLMMTEATTEAVTAITLSDQEVKDLARRSALVSDSKHDIAPVGNPYDKRLQKLIADHTQRDGRSFNYKVYLANEVNAFAMADGTIRVYSGLMDLMNDEELLFVIGHEMGHVVKDHSRKKVVLAYATSALRKGLASQDNQVGQIASSVIGSFAEQLTHAQFSQHEERQADMYGAAFLQTEGYQISSAVSALNKLAELARQHTFLSSHPDPEARAKRLMRGDEDEGEAQDSLFGKLVEEGKEFLVSLLYLIRFLFNWLLSLL
ncbi:M48 family metallopeptidase [Desulfoprunum benzoelyticum]|uniref:Putative metalloprotease n=1 Tax=Desulfoprunum benzoelyticum TaxID=1506996 RepID=A0A840UWI0_9BACT|nr:M48 family metallopeptidase [Desulfoprunum benzoelyticum]MBB5349263.1 putative metalloprotease [Desulfoprunum benzoelyticum]MBM9530988.1 M48 family metallopeptidase [Desulfoprunum benzoelyticum]